MRHTDIEPNTPEWLELRKNYRTASEAAIVCGISPFTKPEKFKLIKAGLAKQFYNKAMQLGHESEEATRKWASERLGVELEEAIFTRDGYLASLDGYSPADGGTVVEIKASSHTYNNLMDGIVPEYYWLQIQQQLFCSESKWAYLVAWCPKTDKYKISKVIEFDPAAMERIEAGWKDFDAMLLPEGDIDASDNQTLLRLFEKYAQLKARSEMLAEEMDDIKAQILDQASTDRTTLCQGYKVEYRKPAKKVDYRKAATVAKLDLEPYTTVAEAGSYVLKMAPSPFEADDD